MSNLTGIYKGISQQLQWGPSTAPLWEAMIAQVDALQDAVAKLQGAQVAVPLGVTEADLTALKLQLHDIQAKMAQPVVPADTAKAIEEFQAAEAALAAQIQKDTTPSV